MFFSRLIFMAKRSEEVHCIIFIDRSEPIFEILNFRRTMPRCLRKYSSERVFQNWPVYERGARVGKDIVMYFDK